MAADADLRRVGEKDEDFSGSRTPMLRIRNRKANENTEIIMTNEQKRKAEADSAARAGRAHPSDGRILKWTHAILKRYPRTIRVVAAVAALACLVGHLPVVHSFLLPLVQFVGTSYASCVVITESIGENILSSKAN